MGVRDKLKRLERTAKGELESFELLNGSRYYYDRASPELFMHWCECMKAGSAHNWPPAPELVRKLREAKNPKAALEQIYPQGPSSFYSLVYDPQILVDKRRLEPRGLVAHREPDTGEWYIGDPYEETSPEDLSSQHRRLDDC
jgi:hypothetical protein